MALVVGFWPEVEKSPFLSGDSLILVSGYFKEREQGWGGT